MIGNKLEQSIILVFQANLSKTFSINQISKILHKSYPNINKKTNFLLDAGVLKKIDIGSSYQCYLNLQNEKAKIFMSMNEINNTEISINKDKQLAKARDIILEIDKNIQQSNPYIHKTISTIVYHKKNILIIQGSNNHDEKKQLINSIKNNSKLLGQSSGFHIISMSKNDFQELFLRDETLQEDHAVLVEAHNYVNLLSEITERLLMKAFIRKD